MALINIENIEFGKKLEEIKNNKGFVNTPIVLTTDTVLNIKQFLKILENGLTIDASLSSIDVETPSALEIMNALPFNKYQNITFKVNSFVQNLPSTNVCTFTGGNGISYILLGINKQQTITYTLTCSSVNPPLFVLSFTT